MPRGMGLQKESQALHAPTLSNFLTAPGGYFVCSAVITVWMFPRTVKSPTTEM